MWSAIIGIWALMLGTVSITLGIKQSTWPGIVCGSIAVIGGAGIIIWQAWQNKGE